MRILAFDHESQPLPICDVRIVLRGELENGNEADIVRREKLIELVDRLCDRGPEHDEYAMVIGHVMTLVTSVTLRFWADHFDYGPIVNGMPVFHFRLEVRSKEGRVLRETRRPTADEMADVILASWSPNDEFSRAQ